MSTTLTFFCLPTIGLALFGIVLLVLREYRKRHPEQVAGWIAWITGMQSTPAPVVVKKDELAQALPSDEQSLTMDKRLRVTKARQTVNIIGEGELQVIAAVVLQPLWQEVEGESAWEPYPKREPCKALKLGRGIWIFRIPKKEQGQYFWVVGNEIDAPPRLKEFFRGTDSNPGPARQFRENEQTDPVAYHFPGDRKTDWSVVDIGAFGIAVEGTSHEMVTGDRLYFVTSKTDAGEWLLFLNARGGEAQGTGMLFRGKEFEPDVEVTQLL